VNCTGQCAVYDHISSDAFVGEHALVYLHTWYYAARKHSSSKYIMYTSCTTTPGTATCQIFATFDAVFGANNPVLSAKKNTAFEMLLI